MYDRHGHRVRLCDPDWTEIEAKERGELEPKPAHKAPPKPTPKVTQPTAALWNEGIPSYVFALRSIQHQNDILREEMLRAAKTVISTPFRAEFEHALRSLRN